MPLGLSGNGLITGFDPTASGFGKVLQVVRATDTTARTTTSTSYVDASISVTITPQKNTSAILLIWSAVVASNTLIAAQLRIADSSDNAISGAESARMTLHANAYEGFITTIGYSTPATISATTYKGRFTTSSGQITLLNATNTGQMYAIEVAA